MHIENVLKLSYMLSCLKVITYLCVFSQGYDVKWHTGVTDCWITSARLIDGMNGQREGEETVPVHSFHSNEWTKLRDVRIS